MYRDEVLFGLISTSMPTDLPVIHVKISDDLFNTNYVKLLDYFNKKTDLLKFYQRISTLNMLVDIMEKYSGSEHYRVFLIHYFGHLKTALNEGEKISI